MKKIEIIKATDLSTLQEKTNAFLNEVFNKGGDQKDIVVDFHSVAYSTSLLHFCMITYSLPSS